MLRTIETTLIVTDKGEIRVPPIAALPPGEHKVVLVIEEAPAELAETSTKKPPKLHAFALTDGRNNATYSRQEIYGDDGR